jgi:hypothetical protein
MTTPYWPFLQKEQNKKQGREVFVGKQDKTFVLSIRRFFCKKNLEVMSGPSLLMNLVTVRVTEST